MILIVRPFFIYMHMKKAIFIEGLDGSINSVTPETSIIGTEAEVYSWDFRLLNGNLIEDRPGL